MVLVLVVWLRSSLISYQSSCYSSLLLHSRRKEPAVVWWYNGGRKLETIIVLAWIA